jgi:AraC-like DNA-binding protein
MEFGQSMSGPPKILQEDDQADGGGTDPLPQRPPGFIIDYAYRSSKLDEIEHVVNTTVTPHRLVPSTRDRNVDSAFRFHGVEDLAVFDVRYGSHLAVEFQPYEAEDLLGFVMATEGNGQLLLDREEFVISGQQGAIVTSGPRETLQYTDLCETRVLLMNRRKIEEYCAKLLGREVDRPIEFKTQFHMGDAAGQSWLRLVQYTAAELSHSQSLVRHLPAARRQLEQAVMTGFLLGHQSNYWDALRKPQSAAAPYYVKRAEAYIEAHFAEPLSLADIAVHSGVSARSLQSGFQNFRGMTPIAFLRRVRLAQVRQRLLNADPAVSSVTEIAMDCGFTHMGEFAASYKRAFGEAPSQTLFKSAGR